MGTAGRPELRAKLWRFAEGPILWGALGVLVGAIGSLARIYYLFGLAWLLIVIAIVRANFFDGKAAKKRFLWNFLLSLLIAARLTAVYHALPKPKALPTANEIADEIVKKMP